MLVLTRKKDEKIIIGDEIEITVVDIDGGKVRLGIKAPEAIDIYREEVYREIEALNKEAAIKKGISIAELAKLIKKEGEKDNK